MKNAKRLRVSACNKAEAEQLRDDLKKSEYALFDALRATSIMTVRTQGKLVDMAKRLRSLRYEIEVEAQID